MPQRDVELILVRQLASTLAVPTLITDAAGDLVFLNEPAEVLLGRHYDDLGELSSEERRRILAFRDDDGRPIADTQYPLVVALRERRPVHRRVHMRTVDGSDRAIEVTAYPLEAAGGHVVGSVAMFWERHRT